MSGQHKYKDKSIPVEKRIEHLINIMTLEEKAGQLCQMDLKQVDAEYWIKEKYLGSCLHIIGEDVNHYQKMALETRLGIPLLVGIDAIHGNGFYPGSTVFPTQLTMSCSWNPELIEKIAHAAAKEVAATGSHWTFSPVLCIARDLRWGRIDETFGEDTYLIGELGKAMIKGYQGDDLSGPHSIIACAKHYLGYSGSQGGRDAVEADLSKRKILSTFFPPFEQASLAGCRSFMVAYQSIDGIPCTINQWLLKDLLRDRAKFNGFFITDWGNIKSLVTRQYVFDNYSDAAAASLNAGINMSMSVAEFCDAVIEAVNNGILDEKTVDQACIEILKIKFELGLFDQNKIFINMEESSQIIHCREHQELALEAACQSIVLLSNKNNILPLTDQYKKIAVMGPNADNIDNQLGDWSTHATGQVDRAERHPEENVITVLKGIQNRAGVESRIHYLKGCDIYDSDEDNLTSAEKLAGESDLVVLVLGDDLMQTGERRDRANLELSGKQEELVHVIKMTGTPFIVILINGKPLSIPNVIEKADAVIEAWNPGLQGGNAIAGILYGDRCPEGKLTISFPYHVGQQPVYYDQYSGWHAESYIDMPKDPLFAFGYGLSYTSFHYSRLRIKNKDLKKDEDLEVAVTIKNIGERAGTEIAQLYINDIVSSLTTPIKKLKAFQKVSLAQGEEKQVHFLVSFEELSLINENLQKVVEPGQFEVMVGSSSRDRDLLKGLFRVNNRSGINRSK